MSNAEQSYRDAWQRIVDIHGAPTCAVCAATTEWTVHGGLMVPTGNAGEATDPADFRAPLIQILCQRCGHVLLFDLAHFFMSER